MQVDYNFAEKIHQMADELAGIAIRATYEEWIDLHSILWDGMYNQFDDIIRACNKQMEKIGNI